MFSEGEGQTETESNVTERKEGEEKTNSKRNKEKKEREVIEKETQHRKKSGGLQGRGASCSYSNRWYAGPITTPKPGC